MIFGNNQSNCNLAFFISILMNLMENQFKHDVQFYDFAEPTKKALEFYSNNIGPYSYEKLVFS